MYVYNLNRVSENFMFMYILCTISFPGVPGAANRTAWRQATRSGVMTLEVGRPQQLDAKRQAR